jgi:hypothetical protein
MTPDRVEWSFKLNPYAEERCAGLVRHSTGELSMYIVRSQSNGEYQTVVEKQAIFDEGRGRNDPHLAETVASVTQNLLGPSGAYHVRDAA